MGVVEAEMMTAIWRMIDAGAAGVSKEEVLAVVVPPEHPEYRLRPAYAQGLERLSRRGWLNSFYDESGTLRYSPARPREALTSDVAWREGERASGGAEGHPHETE